MELSEEGKIRNPFIQVIAEIQGDMIALKNRYGAWRSKASSVGNSDERTAAGIRAFEECEQRLNAIKTDLHKEKDKLVERYRQAGGPSNLTSFVEEANHQAIEYRGKLIQYRNADGTFDFDREV
jgi:hypothetical protein